MRADKRQQPPHELARQALACFERATLRRQFAEARKWRRIYWFRIAVAEIEAVAAERAAEKRWWRDEI